MHNMPGIPVGHFAIRPGALMAAADQFDITVTGKGGHAAKPHECIDTTVVAAHIIVALQTIASRGVDPLKQVVVSVCTVATDSTAHNVIPQVVMMKGTVRTMDPKVQDYVERRISEIVTGTASGLGGDGRGGLSARLSGHGERRGKHRICGESGARRVGAGGCQYSPADGGGGFQLSC